jgi:hypothetical protein
VTADGPPAGLLEPGTAVEPLTHNAANEATGGIWRLTRPGGGSRVLKIATPRRHVTGSSWRTSDEPTHWNYWQREALAYRAGLPATAYADAGIAGPALVEVRDLADGSVALWLEHVDGVPGAAWTVAAFRDFATRLGAAQARWCGAPPRYPWLSRRWLRGYARSRPDPGRVDWDHPVIAAVWPAPLRAGVARLGRDVGRLLDVVETLPRTLTHLDVWPANLIATPAVTVLLDWSFVGEGALGEDIGNLVVDAFADGLVPVTLLPETTAAVTGGYLDGLRAAGNTVDPATVVRAVHASAAAKYAWFGPRMAARVVAGEHVGSTFYDAGGSVADRLARWRPLLETLVAWAAEVLDT